MEPSEVIASTRRKPKKRVHLSKSRAQQRSVAPQLEPGAPSDLELMKAIQAGDPDALSLIEVPAHLNPEGQQHFIPTGEMQRLGVGEDAVEVEQQSVEHVIIFS